MITDAAGNIVGTVDLSPQKDSSDDSPSSVGIIAREGQTLYEVEAPAEYARMSATELHSKYLVEVEGIEAKLVERGTTEGRRSRPI
jgi:hypothetical protein